MQQPRASAGRRSGFTLVELLIVIGIIAVLAAIVAPVVFRARAFQRAEQCRLNQQQIAMGMKMYEDDWGRYPLHLATFSEGGPLQPSLYPAYVPGKAAFHCPDAFRGADDETLIQPVDRSLSPPALASASFPAWDSYDAQFIPNDASGTAELHYRRDWTGMALPGDQREFKYSQPSPDTVVTWCLYHADFIGGGTQPRPGQFALVSFRDGSVLRLPAEKLVVWGPGASQPDDRAWRVRRPAQ